MRGRRQPVEQPGGGQRERHGAQTARAFRWQMGLQLEANWFHQAFERLGVDRRAATASLARSTPRILPDDRHTHGSPTGVMAAIPSSYRWRIAQLCQSNRSETTGVPHRPPGRALILIP